MKTLLLGVALLALTIQSASAWDNPPKPPTPVPTPAPTTSNTNINANSLSSYTSVQNKNLNYVSQFQGQSQTAKGGAGGAGGAGGSVTNNITTGTGGGATPAAAAAPGNTTVNNNGAGQPSTTYANVNTTNNANPWNNPSASAVAPSVYAASICQSAISGAAQTPLFGLSFGSVQGLDVCIKMMLAEQAKSDGNAEMAKYFRCQSKEWRDGYKATGTPCPQDVPKQVVSATPFVAPVQTVSAAPTMPANCAPVSPGSPFVTCR